MRGRESKCNHCTEPGRSRMYVVNGGNHTLMHVLYTDMVSLLKMSISFLYFLNFIKFKQLMQFFELQKL